MRLIGTSGFGIIATILLLSPAAASDPGTQECQSKRGGDLLSHCEVSIYALVAAPEAYAGKRIFTVGYLVHEKHGSRYLGLAPTPAALNANDFLSCFRVVAHTATSAVGRDPYPDKPGIYMTEISGRLELTPGDFCRGELHDARLYDLRLAEPHETNG